MVDRTLLAIGAFAALVGVYLQFAPSKWWLADLSETYHLGSYVLGDYLLGHQSPGDGRLSWRPFWLVVTDGVITAIEEQYTP